MKNAFLKAIKKAILFLLFFLLTAKGFSQVTYFNYLDYSSEWRYYSVSFDGGTGTGFEIFETSYFDGDQTINGQVYYKQYLKTATIHYNDPELGTYTSTQLTGPTYIREDNTGKFILYNSSDNTEIVRFDNQKVLDSQIGSDYPSTNSCTIQFIETVYLGATPLKRIFYGANSATSRGAIEGIGIIGQQCQTESFHDGFFLACYTKQNNSLQFGSQDCNEFPIPTRVNLNMVSNHIEKNTFMVYPNPNEGIFNVLFTTNPINQKYTICDVYGKMMKEGALKNMEQNIDITSFSTGMYILNIKGEGISEYVKILKR